MSVSAGTQQEGEVDAEASIVQSRGESELTNSLISWGRCVKCLDVGMYFLPMCLHLQIPFSFSYCDRLHKIKIRPWFILVLHTIIPLYGAISVILLNCFQSSQTSGPYLPPIASHYSPISISISISIARTHGVKLHVLSWMLRWKEMSVAGEVLRFFA